MSVLNPTPPERLVDAHNRPYFLWDVDLTLTEFEQRVRSPDPVVRAYWLAKAMRQARPDDVLRFARPAELIALRAQLEPLLGDRRAFWSWLLDRWAARDAGR